MDDHLAAKIFSGANLVMIGNLKPNQSIYCAAPLLVMASLSRTASDALQAEVEGVVRECAAAYWLIAPMACVYKTMHGELAPVGGIVWVLRRAID
jgi:hypothetical protein